jgi:hypothetical protein
VVGTILGGRRWHGSQKGCERAGALPPKYRGRGPPDLRKQCTGCGAVWLARLTGGQEVPGSNPGSPTKQSQVRGHN